MESIALVAILIGIVLIAGVSRRIRDTIVTLPMLYTLFGLLVGLLLAEWIGLSYEDPLVHIIAELTLVMVLATDASRISIGRVSRHHILPMRLLGIGLPLTMALGAVLAAVVLGGLEFWEAAVLAVILAPTDASLGQSVVENLKVPVRIRQALNIESGLNDGIAMPFLILAASLAVSSEMGIGSGFYIKLAVSQIVFGVLAGVALGFLGAKYIVWGHKSGWMSGRFRKIAWLALMLLCYGLAEHLGGNGFIAAFCFGITSGNVIGKHAAHSLFKYAQVENTLLMLLTFIIFGMVMLPAALDQITPAIVLYAVLSLTVVRMLPVAVSTIGSKLAAVSVLFLGWFGPRGIASILYVLLIMEDYELVGMETIYAVAMVTVFFSVMAHGITAAPLADWYGKRVAAMDEEGTVDAETTAVPEVPTRAGVPGAEPDATDLGHAPT
jgi:NhaP-type Na+/H+ or K+/H+ antiporter